MLNLFIVNLLIVFHQYFNLYNWFLSLLVVALWWTSDEYDDDLMVHSLAITSKLEIVKRSNRC